MSRLQSSRLREAKVDNVVAGCSNRSDVVETNSGRVFQICLFMEGKFTEGLLEGVEGAPTKRCSILVHDDPRLPFPSQKRLKISLERS